MVHCVLLLLLSAAAAPTEPLARLASDAWEVWNPAARALAAQPTPPVDQVLDEVRAGRVAALRAQTFLEALPAAARLAAVRAHLRDAHDGVRDAVSGVLEHVSDPTLAPALVAAMEAETNDQVRWQLARGLWQLAAAEDMADAILGVARKLPADKRWALVQLVDDPIGRPRLGNEERVAYLLEHRLPQALDGGSAASVDYEENLPLDEQHLAFLESERDALTDRLLADLDKNRSVAAAYLLGWFEEPRALEPLRQAWVRDDYFYGWETSSPCPLDPPQYPRRHVYELAMEQIVGEPVERLVKLTAAEVRGLRMTRAGLYVLSRLHPRTALAEFAARFRGARPTTTDCCERIEYAHALADHLLRRGTTKAQLEKLLGAPAVRTDDTWMWPAPGPKGATRLVVTFRKDRLLRSRVARR